MPDLPDAGDLPVASLVRQARHPRVDVEIVIEERLVDVVAEGYDAGVRLSEAIERDMVRRDAP